MSDRYDRLERLLAERKQALAHARAIADEIDALCCSGAAPDEAAAREARLAGYEGGPCPQCGQRKLVRSGERVVCEGCVPPEDEQSPDPRPAAAAPPAAGGPTAAVTAPEPPRARLTIDCGLGGCHPDDGSPPFPLCDLDRQLYLLRDRYLSLVLRPEPAAEEEARQKATLSGVRGVVVLPAEGASGSAPPAPKKPRTPKRTKMVKVMAPAASTAAPRPCVCGVCGASGKRPEAWASSTLCGACAAKAGGIQNADTPGREHDWHDARGATCCRACGRVRRGDDGPCPGPPLPAGEVFVLDPRPSPTAQTEGA